MISIPDPSDKLIRSGVIYSIYNQLLKYYEVIWIKPELKGGSSFFYKLVAKTLRLMNKMGYGVTEHNPLLSKMRCRSIQMQLKEYQYDAIFSFDCMNIAYLKTDKPIYYRSDGLFHLLIDYYIYNIPQCFVKWGDQVEEKTLENIKCMFAPSQWVIDGAKKYYPNVDFHKISLIESGANVYSDASFSEHTYLNKSIYNMIFIGFDVKRKGIDIAYDTLVLLNEKYGVNTCLTIIGGTPEIRIQKDKRVRCLGKLNKNNPKDLNLFYEELSNADFFIFPTRAECHGIVNCEACAFGLPIFSYATGGVPSYVINDFNGFAFSLDSTAVDFAEKIVETIQNKKLGYYSNNSRKLFETRFNWDVWGSKVNKIILDNYEKK